MSFGRWSRHKAEAGSTGGLAAQTADSPQAVKPYDPSSSTIPPGARALAVLAAVTLGAVLPMLMVVANKSAPATLAAAALFANLAAYRAGYGAVLWHRTLTLLGTSAAALVAALVLIFLCSLAWSIDPALTRRGLIEALPELVSALAMAAAWPLVAARRDFVWLVAGLFGAAGLMLVEHRFGMPLHALARARGEAWDLKRSAIPPLLLLWPAWTYAMVTSRRVLACGLVGAVATGIVVAHSGAPGFALIAAAVLGLAALVLPKVSVVASAAVVALLILLAPWTGTIAARVLPPGVEAALAEEHAAHRIRIWSAFEERARDRWVMGHGFNASFKVSEASRADGHPPGADDSEMVNNHPHNVFLELWVELGVLGAAAGLGVAAFVFVRLGRMEPRMLAPRLALLVSVVGVGLVGLSAWQPWWLASVAASLLWFDLLAARYDA